MKFDWGPYSHPTCKASIQRRWTSLRFSWHLTCSRVWGWKNMDQKKIHLSLCVYLRRSTCRIFYSTVNSSTQSNIQSYKAFLCNWLSSSNSFYWLELVPSVVLCEYHYVFYAGHIFIFFLSFCTVIHSRFATRSLTVWQYKANSHPSLDINWVLNIELEKILFSFANFILQHLLYASTVVIYAIWKKAGIMWQILTVWITFCHQHLH